MVGSPEVHRYRSAGGVVIQENKILLLERPQRDEIRLPKGHIEEGESIEHAALRETTEETGYADLNIEASLGHQIVEFDYQSKHFIRTEYYFLMSLNSKLRTPQPQQDSIQFRPLWVPISEAVEYLTFEAEKHVARKAAALAAGI